MKSFFQNESGKDKFSHSFLLWKKKQEKAEDLMINQPVNQPDLTIQNLEKEFIAACENIVMKLNCIEKQMLILNSHYSDYSKILGMGDLEQIEEDISASLNLIYTDGSGIIKFLKKKNPDVFFKNSDLTNEDIENHQLKYEELRRRFKTLWVELYDLKESHKFRKHYFVKNYMQTIHFNIEDEKIDDIAMQIVESMDLSDQYIFNTNLKAFDILNYVQARHKQVLHLEESLHEVHQLYVDIWALTQEQGYTIDMIRKNIQSARQMVKDSVTILSEAHQSAHKPSFL